MNEGMELRFVSKVFALRLITSRKFQLPGQQATDSADLLLHFQERKSRLHDDFLYAAFMRNLNNSFHK
jgi:hypothetical protein